MAEPPQPAERELGALLAQTRRTEQLTTFRSQPLFPGNVWGSRAQTDSRIPHWACSWQLWRAPTFYLWSENTRERSHWETTTMEPHRATRRIPRRL